MSLNPDTVVDTWLALAKVDMADTERSGPRTSRRFAACMACLTLEGTASFSGSGPAPCVTAQHPRWLAGHHRKPYVIDFAMSALWFLQS